MSGAFICNAFDLPFSGVMKYAKNIHVPAYRKGGGGYMVLLYMWVMIRTLGSNPAPDQMQNTYMI